MKTTKAFLRAAARVFREGSANAQAIAFNLFVAFFPLIVLALGVVAASKRLSTAVIETLHEFRWVLPSSSRQLVMDFLVTQTHKSRTLLTLGALGTVFTGTQVMTCYLSGIRRMYRDTNNYGFFHDQLRGFILLLVSFLPLLMASMFTVFGQQVRGWMIRQFGLPHLFNSLWTLIYGGLALLLAALVLSLLYHMGHPQGGSWNNSLPGAIVATLLWWVVNTAFGMYVHRVPYSVVYGGLAAAIGLAVWMNLSALVVLYGAAFNAERDPARTS